MALFTGTGTFKDGVNACGSAILSGETAALTGIGESAGMHSITAVYTEIRNEFSPCNLLTRTYDEPAITVGA